MTSAKPTDPSPEAGTSRRESLDFELLYLIEKEPGLPQRQIAERLGISLGKVNYCLKVLANEGAIELGSVRTANNKQRRAYVLTSRGISQRVDMNERILLSRLREYERLKSQIETLESERHGGSRHG